MNKGIFAHLIATWFCIMQILYVVSDQHLDIRGRAIVIFIILFTNFIVALFSDMNGWYKQKI